ncbi:MAG: type-F conjugative transfer system secretin TraK [Desulfobacteraceae bacterium]
MTIKTSKRFYEVLLKPDKDVGPVVMLAKQTLKDAPSAKGYEYLTTKGLNYIRISNNEINRVSCDHKDVKIEKVILPTDSGIEKESDGSNAYIRYRGQKDVVVHITTTSGKVYSACLKPAKVDAKTLILKNSNSTDSIIGLYGNKREEVVVELIKSAITNINDLSEARITQKSKNITTIDQIKIKEHARYQFDTDGIILIEYDLTLIPKVETKVHIDEEYLYDKYFKNIDKNSGNIMGLGLNNDYVYPNRNTSLFVVFRSHHLNE